MVAQQDLFVQDVAGVGPMWISADAQGLAHAPIPGMAGKGNHARVKGGSASKPGAAKRPGQVQIPEQPKEHAGCAQYPEIMLIVAQLQHKVTELEAWRSRATEDIRSLRNEHWQLKSGLAAHGSSYPNSDAASTSPGSTCAVDMFDGCSPVPSSPISLCELLPLAGSVTSLGSRKTSNASLLSSPSSTCAAPAALTAPKPPRFSAPPGLDPPSMEFPAVFSAAQATLVLPSSEACLPALDRSGLPPSLLCKASPEPSLALQRCGEKVVESPKPFAGDDHENGLGEGVRVGPCQILGSDCIRAEWRIENLSARLKSSMGKPIVSPPFIACGLPDLRLLVFPEVPEAKGMRNRKSKEKYVATVMKGPLLGSLKLKAANLEKYILDCYLTVGAIRRGPFSYDFSEQAMYGCEDFGEDWLKHIDTENSWLRVSLEIVNVHCK